jgi:outer membrane lipoprotein-sorting protein
MKQSLLQLFLRTVPAVALCAGLAAAQTAAPADNPEALHVAQRTEAALRGKTQHGRAAMTVKRPEWQRTLEMEFWYVAPRKTFVTITAPAKDAGTRTLLAGTNMWMYLPSVERVIKIAPSLMLQPWMGSDFTNDDLVKESSLVDDYLHRLDGETTEDGDACYRLVASAKPNAPVVWDKIVALIRKSDYLPRREDYYDEHGTLVRTLYFDQIRRTGDRNFPMRWRVESHTKPGQETTLTYSSLVFDKSVADSIFTMRNLERRF